MEKNSFAKKNVWTAQKSCFLEGAVHGQTDKQMNVAESHTISRSLRRQKKKKKESASEKFAAAVGGCCLRKSAKRTRMATTLWCVDSRSSVKTHRLHPRCLHCFFYLSMNPDGSQSVVELLCLSQAVPNFSLFVKKCKAASVCFPHHQKCRNIMLAGRKKILFVVWIPLWTRLISLSETFAQTLWEAALDMGMQQNEFVPFKCAKKAK